MVTQKQLKEHFLSLKDALYVWGANCKVITKEYMDILFKTFGSKKYDRAYYDKALKEGEGKIGTDCSGALNPVSGYDTTAQGYYNRCTKKGKIDSIPKDKVCLVFKRNSSNVINHVGCYTGDGYVSEMASTKEDYERKPLANNGWDDWGFPDFVDYNEVENETVKKEVNKMETLKRGYKGPDVTVFETVMRKLGYYDGEIDQSFGPKCEVACNEFQEDYPECGTNGEPDSSWGKRCWRKALALVTP